MNWLTVLGLVILSIVLYCHVMPILDRLSEYIQTIILTKKMRVNVEYTNYEKMIEAVSRKDISSQKVVGFQVDDTEEENEDE